MAVAIRAAALADISLWNGLCCAEWSMPNWRFSDTGVACWFCAREDEWAFRGDDPPLADHYGYVRVSGLLIPACERCARVLAGPGGIAFDVAVWRQEAFLQDTFSCKYRTSRRVRLHEPTTGNRQNQNLHLFRNLV
jgi:hypothetical protein